MPVIHAGTIFNAIRAKVGQIENHQSLMERGQVYGRDAVITLGRLQGELNDLRRRAA